MSTSAGARAALYYIAETTPGTTPSTPQMIEVPKASMSLNLAKEVLDDPTILSDRMEVEERHGNLLPGGTVSVTLQHGQFDDWLEAALGGTWATNQLNVGSTRRTFTIEQWFADNNISRRFTGMAVDTFSLSVTPNAVVSADFGFIGMGHSTAGAQLDATPTALQSKLPLTHIGATMQVGGSAAVLTGLTLEVNNGINRLFGIGSSTAVELVPAESSVTGTATFYFEDLTAYNRFVNETAAAISCQLTDGTNTLTFLLPRVKFNTATVDVPNSGVIFVSMDFKALKDAATGTTLRITRS